MVGGTDDVAGVDEQSRCMRDRRAHTYSTGVDTRTDSNTSDVISEMDACSFGTPCSLHNARRREPKRERVIMLLTVVKVE